MNELPTLIQPDFNPANYPRSYRSSGGSAVLLRLTGMVGLGGGALGAWYFGLRMEPATLAQKLLGEIIFSSLCVLGIYLLLLVARFKVVLEADRIEHQTAVFHRTLRRGDIRGWRYVQGRNSPATLLLVPREGAGAAIKLALMFRRDQDFENWVDTLPSLDAGDLQQAAREVASNEEVGSTPEERFATLKQARRTALALNIAGAVTLVWTLVYPWPLELLTIVLTAQPWTVLYLISRFHGLIQIDDRKNDVRPSATFGVIPAGFALLILSLRGPHILEWRSVIWLPIAVGLALLWFARRVDRSQRINWALLGLVIVSLFYGFGSVVELNSVFDRSAGTVYSVSVVSKNVSHGKSTTYHLKLAPWEFKKVETKVSVSRNFYESVQPGDPVCVILRNGALRIRWYQVAVCK